MKHSYDPKTAGAFIGVTRIHVIRLVESGVLKAYDVSSPGAKRKRYRIPEDALREFLEQRVIQPKQTATPKRQRVAAKTKRY